MSGLTICDMEKLYMGEESIQKVYAGATLIWPCYDCSVEDPIFADEYYDEAVVYLPKVCLAPGQDWATPQIRDGKAVWPWPEEILIPGPGYNGIWSFAGGGTTWGFNAPADEAQYGKTIIEEDSPQVLPGLGITDSGTISFYITTSEIGLDVNGLLIQVGGLEVYLNGYEFFPSAIKARALRESPFFPIEVVATESLELDNETFVTVEYEIVEDIEQLLIYYDNVLVGEYIV